MHDALPMHRSVLITGCSEVGARRSRRMASSNLPVARRCSIRLRNTKKKNVKVEASAMMLEGDARYRKLMG